MRPPHVPSALRAAVSETPYDSPAQALFPARMINEALNADENRAAEHVCKCGDVLGVLSGVGRVLCLAVERERLRHIPRRRPRQV